MTPRPWWSKHMLPFSVNIFSFCCRVAPKLAEGPKMDQKLRALFTDEDVPFMVVESGENKKSPVSQMIQMDQRKKTAPNWKIGFLGQKLDFQKRILGHKIFLGKKKLDFFGQFLIICGANDYSFWSLFDTMCQNGRMVKSAPVPIWKANSYFLYPGKTVLSRWNGQKRNN